MNMKQRRQKEKKTEDPVIVTHHEARRDYFIIETLEAGLVLSGCEVKSLREHKASLSGSFARLEGNEMFLYNLYIAPYEMGNRENPEEPTHTRKLLLRRAQIEKLRTKALERGFTLIPLKLYFNKRGIAKVELAVAKGKKLWDKRTDIKKRDAQRDMDRALKSKNR